MSSLSNITIKVMTDELSLQQLLYTGAGVL